MDATKSFAVGVMRDQTWLKMVDYARSGGNIEIMGLMQGKTDGDAVFRSRPPRPASMCRRMLVSTWSSTPRPTDRFFDFCHISAGSSFVISRYPFIFTIILPNRDYVIGHISDIGTILYTLYL